MTHKWRLPFSSHPFNSLRARLIISALVIVLIVLPTIGLALNKAFAEQVKANLQAQLNAYFYAVLAVTEFDGGELFMPEVLLENQFNVINSGLYALISESSLLGKDGGSDASTQAPREGTNILWFSNSFLGAELDASLPAPALGSGQFSQVTINGSPHFIYSYSVRFDLRDEKDNGSATAVKRSPIITLHIIKDMQGISEQQEAFNRQLWLWLFVLMGVLVVIQLFWLAWTLRPLARFTKELSAVEKGQAEQLPQSFPDELNAVAKQLNALLTSEQGQRVRYRNALSDLAHSLKTPLAVVQSQHDLSESSAEQIRLINRIISHQLKRAQSAGNTAWHVGVPLAPITDKLLRTLPKIYPKINISYAQKPLPTSIFKGDEIDLTEILGNLLDNASKAAKSQVLLSVVDHQNALHIEVEDDGNGVPDAVKSVILERGKRADSYDKGHGIGLAIVRDLVQSYQGDIAISQSDTLGGAKFLLIFNK